MLAPKRYLFLDLEKGQLWGRGVSALAGGKEEGNQVISFSSFFLGRGKSPTSALINPQVSEKRHKGGPGGKRKPFHLNIQGDGEGILRKESSGSQATIGLCVYL